MPNNGIPVVNFDYPAFKGECATGGGKSPSMGFEAFARAKKPVDAF